MCFSSQISWDRLEHIIFAASAGYRDSFKKLISSPEMGGCARSPGAPEQTGRFIPNIISVIHIPWLTYLSVAPSSLGFWKS